MATPRMTMTTRLVLQTLLGADEAFGAEIGARTHLPSGTVHPILARLEGVGWVTSRWEDVDPASAGRPARRYYRLTDEGRAAARAALDRAGSRVRVTGVAAAGRGL